jgi:hypothetical protein
MLKIKVFELYYQIINSFKKLFWLVKQKKLILGRDYYVYKYPVTIESSPDLIIWF